MYTKMNEFIENMSQHEFFQYLNLKKRIIKLIQQIQQDYDIPTCDTFPETYDGLIELYDDLHRHKGCSYALREWIQSKYTNLYLIPD